MSRTDYSIAAGSDSVCAIARSDIESEVGRSNIKSPRCRWQQMCDGRATPLVDRHPPRRLEAAPVAQAKHRRIPIGIRWANIDKKLSLEATQNGIDQLYTIQKVAELLSVDDAFVLELIKTRKITGIKLNEQMTRIPAGSIQRYLAKLTK